VCETFVRIAEEASRTDVSRELLERNVTDALRRMGHDVQEEPLARVWLSNWLENERGRFEQAG
jgi:hypothetical protein